MRTTKATPPRLILQLYLLPLIQGFRTNSTSQLKSYYAIQRYASDIWGCIFVVIDWLISHTYTLFIYKRKNPQYYCKKMLVIQANHLCATTSRKLPPVISDRQSKTPKIFPVKPVQLEPLVNDHLLKVIATTFWSESLNDFLLFLTSCKRVLDAVCDIYFHCVHCNTLNIRKTWNYTWRNLEIACNKLSSIK